MTKTLSLSANHTYDTMKAIYTIFAFILNNYGCTSADNIIPFDSEIISINGFSSNEMV